MSEHPLPFPPDRITEERNDDARRLLEVNRRFYDAFEKLDIEEMANVWAHSHVATCMHPSPGWSLLKGWETIRESWELIFSRIRSVRFELSDIRVVLAGNIAWTIVTENLQAFLIDTDDQIRETSVATNIFERAGSSWRLLHHHATLLLLEDDEEKGHHNPETLPSALPEQEDIPLQPDQRDTLRHNRKDRPDTLETPLEE